MDGDRTNEEVLVRANQKESSTSIDGSDMFSDMRTFCLRDIIKMGKATQDRKRAELLRGWERLWTVERINISDGGWRQDKQVRVHVRNLLVIGIYLKITLNYLLRLQWP